MEFAEWVSGGQDDEIRASFAGDGGTVKMRNCSK
jgi:hypothetical protein